MVSMAIIFVYIGVVVHYTHRYLKTRTSRFKLIIVLVNQVVRAGLISLSPTLVSKFELLI